MFAPCLKICVCIQQASLIFTTVSVNRLTSFQGKHESAITESMLHCAYVVGTNKQKHKHSNSINNSKGSVNGNVTVTTPAVVESGGGCEGAASSPNPTPPCSETESPGWAGSA